MRSVHCDLVNRMNTSGLILLLVQLLYSRGVALKCYACMSIEILETDRPVGSKVPPLYDTVVEVSFNNTAPPQCDDASLVTCPEGQRCMTTKVISWGIYSGINGKVDIHISRCYEPGTIGFEKLPQHGCGDVNDIYNFEQMGAIYNGVFNKSEGSSCTCGENGCNLLSKLCDDIPVCDFATVPGSSPFLMGVVFIMPLTWITARW